jgi:hypothetical protein
MEISNMWTGLYLIAFIFCSFGGFAETDSDFSYYLATINIILVILITIAYGIKLTIQ